jgi:glycosyltransferase domain-containing protein
MNSELTFVIFTKNRPERLLKTLEVISRSEWPAIIADGSEMPIAPSRLPSRRFNYLHMPGASVGQRLFHAMEKVESKYCCLHADDDRMSPPTLLECVEVLEQEGRASRSCGTTIHTSSITRDGIRFAFPDLAVERILDLTNPPCPRARYLEIKRVFPQVFYGVMRTPIALAIARVGSEIADDAGILAEELWVTLPALLGGTLLVDRIQTIREAPMVGPNHEQFRSQFDSLDSLSEWPGFAAFKARLIIFCEEVGVSQDLADDILEKMEVDCCAFPEKQDSGPKPPRDLLAFYHRIRLMAANPFVLQNRNSRFRMRRLAKGLANRHRTRCHGYPWKTTEDLLRAMQTIDKE